jgi:hypothetical protein
MRDHGAGLERNLDTMVKWSTPSVPRGQDGPAYPVTSFWARSAQIIHRARSIGALRITVGRSAGRNRACRRIRRAGRMRIRIDTTAIRSDRRRWKWVKVWRTSRPGSCQVGAEEVGPVRGSPSAQSDPGQPSMPPRRPEGGRVSRRNAPSIRGGQGRRCHGAPAWLSSASWRAAPLRCPVAPRRPAIRGQMPQAGDFGVQIVAPRSMSACAWHPGRSRRRQARGERLQLRLGGWQRLCARRRAGHDTLDVSVEDRRGPVEGDGGDGGCGIRPDPGSACSSPPYPEKRPPSASDATTRAHFRRLRARA